MRDIAHGSEYTNMRPPKVIAPLDGMQLQGKFFNKSSAVAEMGDRLATIGMGRKWGGAAVGGWVPTGSPSNTMWTGPRPTSLPSGISVATFRHKVNKMHFSDYCGL